MSPRSIIPFIQRPGHSIFIVVPIQIADVCDVLMRKLDWQDLPVRPPALSPLFSDIHLLIGPDSRVLVPVPLSTFHTNVSFLLAGWPVGTLEVPPGTLISNVRLMLNGMSRVTVKVPAMALSSNFLLPSGEKALVELSVPSSELSMSVRLVLGGLVLGSQTYLRITVQSSGLSAYIRSLLGERKYTLVSFPCDDQLPPYSVPEVPSICYRQPPPYQRSSYQRSSYQPPPYPYPVRSLASLTDNPHVFQK